MFSLRLAAIIFGLSLALQAQVIEFESGGLHYQTLTRNGVTIMFAHLPAQVRDYNILQVAVSNGTKRPVQIKPEDFIWRREDSSQLVTSPARIVVKEMIEKASRSDVIRLVSTYELGIYGLSRLRSTSGYEQRRQAALAEVNSAKLKAAAAASAISFVATKLSPGETTDGAVFFKLPVGAKTIGTGKLIVSVSADVYEFNNSEPAITLHGR